MSLPSSGDVTRLTVLSLLSMGPFHGYGLREVMESWHMHAWADIRYGSIYQALRTMAKDRLVEQVSSHAEGRRPPKTTYRITDAGREELRHLSRRAWSQPSRYVEPINVALSLHMLAILEDKEVVELLGRRLAHLEEVARQLDAERDAVRARTGDPGSRAALTDHLDHFGRLVATEREWTTHVREQVRCGAYRAGQELPSSENDAESQRRR